MAGQSLVRICSLDTMPHRVTVSRWMLDNEEFRIKYARAREIQAEWLADELHDIAEDDSRDVYGELQMPNSVAVQRAKLRIDTRKWTASKLLPKKYGDRVTQEHTGSVTLESLVAAAVGHD